MSGWFLLLSCFVEISELKANSVDYDQMQHSAVTDLDLHCLPISLFWDARLKLVKVIMVHWNLYLSLVIQKRCFCLV